MARNLYDPATMAAHGLSYYSVGRAPALPDGLAAQRAATTETINESMTTIDARWSPAAPDSWVLICAMPCWQMATPSSQWITF